MAIAKMERLALNFKARRLDVVMRLIQGFQDVHIEIGYESSVPSAKKAELDVDIRGIEKNLQEIQAALSILRGRESGRFANLLKNGEEKRLGAAEFIKTVEESGWEVILEEVIHTDRRLTDNRTRRQEITRLFGELALWEHLKCDPLDFKKLRRSTAVFGSVHRKHADEFAEILSRHEEEGVVYEKIAEISDRTYFSLAHHAGMDEEIGILTSEFSFLPEEYRFVKPQRETRRDLEQEEGELLREERELNELILGQEKYAEILAFAEDYNLNNLLRKKKSLEVTYDGGDVSINGWIVADKRESFERTLEANIPKDDYIALFSSVKENDIDDVPIKLKNSAFVSVYERLTEMYSLPRYDETDPTPVMTVFYLLFFGMMVADFGYGLAVFLAGLAVRRLFKVKRSTRNFMDFLYYLSFPIMGWGLIYGSFFGVELPFRLIAATRDVIPMMLLSIALGYMHIMAGLALQTINLIKHKRYFDMVSGGLAWFVALLGGGLMIVAGASPWFGSDAAFMAGAVTLGVGVGAIVIAPAAQYGRRWYAGLGKGLYSLYGATSYLGDFVSYARLMALGVAGGSVALAFNTILAYLPLPAKMTLGVVLAVVLHGLNIFLSMLSAYVHGIRLQFIEFFGKFYTGGGKRFEPFKAAEKNVIITGEVKEGAV